MWAVRVLYLDIETLLPDHLECYCYHWDIRGKNLERPVANLGRDSRDGGSAVESA